MKLKLYLGALACALFTFASTRAALADTAPPAAPTASPPRGTITTTTPALSGAPNERLAPRGASSVNVGVLGGVGFPRPLAVEGVLQLDRLVLFGVEYSALPTITVDGVQASAWAIAGDARVFPWKGGFFVGLRAGRQHLGEYASATISGVGTLSASQAVDTTFINPRIGFLWNWNHLALGLDAGVQIPVSSTFSTTLPPGITPPSGVNEVTHAFGQGVLPTVDLLRIGLMM